MDELIKKIAGLGFPGILFVIATAASGGSVAVVVSLLSSLGGPLGLLGGLGLLGLVGILAEYIAGFGIDNILKLIYSERSKTESLRFLFNEIQDLPITDELKLKLKHYISPSVLETKILKETTRTLVFTNYSDRQKNCFQNLQVKFWH